MVGKNQTNQGNRIKRKENEVANALRY